MPAPTTTAELLDLVSKSGLTDEARLRAFVGNLTETQSLPPDPARLAGAPVRDGFLTYFQAEVLLQGKWKGFHIGPYAVLEKLGAGTTGGYFLCERTTLHRVVAIKVLPVEKFDNPSYLERFYREARALAACDHPNIVRAYDITQADNLHFLVMEYIDGTNLLDLARRGPLDPVRAASYLAQAANGLQHVHDQGLVHRNVKPGKLMLDRNGTIKLCGFSIVLFRHDAQNMDEAIRGTPNYIAPEQALDSSGVDHRADLYALGCTAYHLLTGQSPCPEGPVAQKLVWHRIHEPRPIRSLRTEVPEELARVVERMMAKDPEARYQSAAEVIAALALWTGTAIPPPPTEEMPTHCLRVQEAIARSTRAQPGAS